MISVKQKPAFRLPSKLREASRHGYRELRAAVGLANLRKLQGRLDEGRTLVKSLYDWFSEGHDTADLRNAEAILKS